jgi:hypothetical protein
MGTRLVLSIEPRNNCNVHIRHFLFLLSTSKRDLTIIAFIDKVQRGLNGK